jgi:hypothetical protein
VAQDCDLLGQFYGNADEGAIGAEELAICSLILIA